MFIKTKNDGILNVKKFAGINISEQMIDNPDHSGDIFGVDNTDKPLQIPSGKWEVVLLKYIKSDNWSAFENANIILETNTKEEAEKVLQSIYDSLRAGKKAWSPNSDDNGIYF